MVPLPYLKITLMGLTALWCVGLTACGGGTSDATRAAVPNSQTLDAGAIRPLSVAAVSASHSDWGVTSALPGVSRLALAPQGQTVAVLSANPAEISVVDVTTRRTLNRLHLPAQSVPVGASFLANGTHLVVVGRDSVAQVWNLTQGTLDLQLRGHAQPVRALASNPQGNRLATVGEDSRLMIWDTKNGRLLSSWSAGSERVSSLAYSVDSTRLAMTGGSSQLRILDAQSGRVLQGLGAESPEMTAAIFSPDGRWLAGVQPAARVTLWSQDSSSKQFFTAPAFQLVSPGVRTAAFSADSKSVVTGGDDGILRWWDTGTGRLLRAMGDGTVAINTLTFAPHSDRTVLAGMRDDRLVFWDLLTGEKEVTFHGAVVDR